MYSKKVDSSKKVDKYFSKNMEYLRSRAKLSLADMAQIIGMGKSIVGNYEKGTAEPSASTALKIVQHFGITLPQLMGEDLSKKGNLKGNPTGNPIANETSETIKTSGKENIAAQVNAQIKAHELKIQENNYVVDPTGIRLVPIVDIRAAAGSGYLNAENFDQDEVMRLPATMVKSGYHLCIRVKGTSMAPTLQDGGFVIIRLLDRSEWLNMANNRIFVVVDHESKTAIKRVKNRFSVDKGFIVLTSDSPDKASYPSYNLQPEEIMSIWYVEWYISAKMPNIHDQFYSRMETLEESVQILVDQFSNFKKQIK